MLLPLDKAISESNFNFAITALRKIAYTNAPLAINSLFSMSICQKLDSAAVELNAAEAQLTFGSIFID